MIDTERYSASFFIDLTKAFDSINHSILLAKLESIGVAGPALAYIESYLLNRSQAVSLSNTLSNSWTYFISDIHNDLPRSLYYCEPFLYTDDTTLLANDTSINNLAEKMACDLKNVLHWCEQGLSAN